MSIDQILQELRAERDKIDAAIKAPSGVGGSNARPRRGSTGRRTLSAAARRKIAAAQRARWARVKAGKK